MSVMTAVPSALRHPRREGAHLARIARLRLRRIPPAPVRFVIFGRGRTGSSMLVDLLDRLPGVHCDDEILHDATLFPRAYVRACAAASGSRAYGCKILSYQLTAVQPLRHPEDFLRELGIDGFQVIHLSRTNLVQHAVSNLRARQYGFHQRGTPSSSTADAKLVVHPGELLSWIEKSEALGDFEVVALERLPHLSLTYEDDLVDSARHGDTLRRVSEFLRLPTDNLPVVNSTYHKVSPVSLADSIENYAEVARHLEGTPYARFLGGG